MPTGSRPAQISTKKCFKQQKNPLPSPIHASSLRSAILGGFRLQVFSIFMIFMRSLWDYLDSIAYNRLCFYDSAAVEIRFGGSHPSSFEFTRFFGNFFLYFIFFLFSFVVFALLISLDFGFCLFAVAAS